MPPFSDTNLLQKLYNLFDTSQALPAKDPKYVDCQEVRGDADIFSDLGNRIRRADNNTYQLYTGHRGAGKSTELLRLKNSLEAQQFYVVYFAADEEDIQSEDTQYIDILLACTRHILRDLGRNADTVPLLGWLKSRIGELQDLLGSEIHVDSFTLETGLSAFAKLTTNIRTEPTMRQKIREKVNPHTVTLIKTLNDFLTEAKQKLPHQAQKLAVIVDNLDRIAPIIQENGQTNHEDIFINRCEQLKALDCHLIYTVPISLVYSSRGPDLGDIYSGIPVLPMIMIRDINDAIYSPGLAKVKEIVSRRVNQVLPKSDLNTEIFSSQEDLERLCLMSGGHVRNLLFLVQTAISKTNQLPIDNKYVGRAISELRTIYRRSIEHDEWQLLVEVHRKKKIINENRCRNLLFNRCVLEYAYLDENSEKQCWYDIHPVIYAIPEFKELLEKDAAKSS